MTDDDARGGPRQVTRESVQPEDRSFFDFNPVLAVYPGPWVFARLPMVGVGLVAVGVLVGSVLLVTVVLVASTMLNPLDGNGPAFTAMLVVAGLLAWGLFAVARHTRRGTLRSSSGKRFSEVRIAVHGSAALARRLHDGLAAGHATRDEIFAEQQRGEPGGRVTVAVYRQPTDGTALATVHHGAETPGPVSVWPPVAISLEQALALVRGSGLGSSPPDYPLD